MERKESGKTKGEGGRRKNKGGKRKGDRDGKESLGGRERGSGKGRAGGNLGGDRPNVFPRTAPECGICNITDIFTIDIHILQPF